MFAQAGVYRDAPSGYAQSVSNGPTAPSVTTSTLDPDEGRRHRRDLAGAWGRRATIGVLVVFVALGLLGEFGYRQTTLEASQDGFEVQLSHPARARGGQPATWRLTVARSDGSPLAGPVVITTTSEYLDTFDFNNLTPQPDRMWQSRGSTQWEYDTADETELVVTLDVRTEPDARWKHQASTVVDVGGHVVAELRYSTWVLP